MKSHKLFQVGTDRWAVRSLTIFVLLFILLTTGCKSTTPTAMRRFEYARAEMGLSFRVICYATNADQADFAANAALDRIAQLNSIMSDYEFDSELSRLSRTSGQNTNVAVSPDLWRVLDEAQKTAIRSHGAFDMSVGPLITLWRRARRQRELPDAESISNAVAKVGYQKIHLNPTHHTVLLDTADMKLDLGAIAKGYAADEAIAVLKTNGITRALVTGGGDMAAADPPPGKWGWSIELPRFDNDPSQPLRFVLLKNAGLATSGDLFQYVEIDGIRYSHIVDPKTGAGLTDHSQITVIAPTGMLADSLSTALSVLGPKAGLALIKQTKGAEADIVRRPSGKIEFYQSPGFSNWLDEP